MTSTKTSINFEKNIYSSAEAAKALGISADAMKKRVSRNLIVSFFIGRKRFISRIELQAYVNRYETT